jgi:hypothetical protein
LNNAGFEVQKSYSKSEEWEPIGYVDNYGDPSSLVEYSFTDNTAHRFPVIRYRLKSIDNDGSCQFSEVIEVNTLPSSYELSQNYPNPFNPSTKIKFTIPSSANPLLEGDGRGGLVTLKVYDILGNEVATLVEEEKEPGTYEVEFASINLASGIYIYQLKSTDFISTKKMMLLR